MAHKKKLLQVCISSHSTDRCYISHSGFVRLFVCCADSEFQATQGQARQGNLTRPSEQFTMSTGLRLHGHRLTRMNKVFCGQQMEPRLAAPKTRDIKMKALTSAMNSPGCFSKDKRSQIQSHICNTSVISILFTWLLLTNRKKLFPVSLLLCFCFSLCPLSCRS